MLSKEDWIASHRKQFPDARPDVLGFIYDFKHNGWKYIPTAKLDFTQTVESDAINTGMYRC